MKIIKIASVAASAVLFGCGAEEKKPIYCPPPDFAAAEFKFERKLNVADGKTSVMFSGAAASLGATRSDMRIFLGGAQKPFSGMVAAIDGDDLKVSSCEKSGGVWLVKFGDRAVAEFAKLPDNRVSLEIKAAGGKKISLRFYLPKDAFARTVLEADGKKMVLDYAESNGLLFSGEIKKAVFCAEDASRAFALETDGAKASVYMRPNLGVFEISKDAAEMKAVFDLGREKIAQSRVAPPKGCVTKVGGIDFWDEERLVLPDTRRKNIMQNPSFEQGFRTLAFRYFMGAPQNPEIWKVRPVKISTSEAKFGSKSLSIFSDAPDKFMRQPLSTASIGLEAGDYVFSVYAKTDNPKGQNLRISFVNGADVYDKKSWGSAEFKLDTQWRRFFLKAKISEPQFAPIAFEASSDYPATCYIDGMQLERGTEPTEYEPPPAEGSLVTCAPDNFIKYGTDTKAALEIFCAPNASGKVGLLVRDFFGEPLLDREFAFKADARGNAKIDLNLGIAKRGIFEVFARYNLDSGQSCYDIERFAVMDFLENKHARKNLFVDTYVDPLSTHQFFPDVLERYKRVGYGARAGYANNSGVIAAEAKKYGVDSLLSYVGRIQRDPKLRRKVIFLENTNWFSIPNLTYKNALLLDDWRNLGYGKITPEYLKKVEEVSEKIVASRPGISAWANLVEPEGSMISFANPAFAREEDFLQFVELECAAARGVRRGNPSAKLSTSITSTLARPDRLLFFDRLLGEAAKRGIRYDCVGAHIYRGAPEYPAPTLEDNFLDLFKIMEKHGMKDADVYSPEGMHWMPVHCYDVCFITDYARRPSPVAGPLPYTAAIGHGERLATALRARTWLLGLKHGRIKTMNASNYGISRMDIMQTPYGYEKVPNTLGCLLGNARFEEEIKIFPDTRCYVFEDESKRPVAAVWACREEFDRGREIPPEISFAPVKNLRLFDLMQDERALKTGNGGIFKMPLTIFPAFLVGEPNSMAEFKKMLAQAKGKSNMAIAPSLKVRAESPESISAEVFNPYKENLAGKISLRADSQDCSVKPSGSEKYGFASSANLSKSALREVYANFTLSLNSPEKGRFDFDRSFRAQLAGRSKGTIVIDGNLSDWGDAPSVKIDNMVRAWRIWTNGIFPAPDDISAEYKILWDDENLYLAVTVRDDKFFGTQRGSALLNLRNDSLSVAFDTLADARDAPGVSAPDGNDWLYGFWKIDGENSPRVYRFRVPDAQLTQGILGAKVHTYADDVKCAFKKIDGGYVWEVAFARTGVMPFNLRENGSLGMCITVNDCDEPAEPEHKARLTTSADKTAENSPKDFPLEILVK